MKIALLPRLFHPKAILMTKRTAFSLTLTLGIIVGFCLSSLSARDEAPNNWMSLEKSYAEASLELAEARLAMAQSQNKDVAGTISKQMMDELQSSVQSSRDLVKQIAVNRKPNNLSPRIAALEGNVNALETSHAESLKANQLQAGAVPEIDLRNETAEINVAKARLAALRALSSQPFEVRVDWEIRMLQDDIRALWARPLIED